MSATMVSNRDAARNRTAADSRTLAMNHHRCRNELTHPGHRCSGRSSYHAVLNMLQDTTNRHIEYGTGVSHVPLPREPENRTWISGPLRLFRCTEDKPDGGWSQ